MDSQRIRDKYTGKTAAQYEMKRKGSKKWENEQNVVELMLNKSIGEQTDLTLADIPVGTGRFFEIYDQYDLDIIGIDISEDMILESESVSKEISNKVEFQIGDLLSSSTIDINADIAVCIRIMNWFSLEEVADALANLSKLDVDYAIVGVRTYPNKSSGWKKKIWLLQAQLADSIINSQDGDGTNIHAEKEILVEIGSNNFQIENRILVDIGTHPNNFGSEYFIYLLKNDRVDV